MLKRGVMECNLVYADGKSLTEPYLSPLFADYAPPFPPVFIQSGHARSVSFQLRAACTARC